LEVSVTSSFHDHLAAAPLLADGAMGTMLHARGIAFDQSFDALNLSQPALVAEIHRAYIDAGAQLIITNTFGANRYKLSEHGLENRVSDINAAAVSLARRVIEASFKPVFIAGSVGPLGVRLAPFGRVKPEQAYAAFREQIATLVESGVDVIWIETMSDLYEVAEAVRAAKEVGRAPIAASLTFTRDDRTLLGDSPAKVGKLLAALGVDILGVNCSGGPAQVLRILGALKQAAPSARLLVKPNAGWPERVGGRIMYPATPEYFGEYALAFVDAGAAIVGGCCGTTPVHIAAMHAALNAPRREKPERGVIVSAAEREERLVSADTPTQLAARLASGKFVIGVEMDPPRGFSTHKLLAGAHLLAEAGADVINVADSPMARMRMSAWAVSHLIQDQVRVETVLHFPTRGRNLLRVQGDLLAAHALGVRNVFVVMGDPTAIGDYPTANDNYDLVPSGLIKLIKQGFNVGVDHAGVVIGQPTSFFVSCAVNMGASDVDKEIKTLRKKIEAGADFALTQPVYELDSARAFIRRYEDKYGPLTLPLLVGILPLYNARHASFLHNEVPGISLPETLRRRMELAGEAGADEGIRIACELLAEAHTVPALRGAYLMPPFGRYELAAEIIERVQAAPTH
jgi:methionine synthase I (cobalamin-dependent)/5,10-methylenetetrahydrofolate reductase